MHYDRYIIDRNRKIPDFLFKKAVKITPKIKNGLIRQYFPKGTDFNEVSAKEINIVVNRLNNRSKKHELGKHRMNYLREYEYIHFQINNIKLIM
ncbi:putative IS30 family transposase [Photorhabdus asymbiotica]|uniref:IS30 family transposase n=1 Tax=Photorhabdus asymbiotica subsp. asymbiotica (strain ATCC 43949 / 3105-77) TaxID=553480 RepID=B6VKN0_PHOAA|nr:putative IS30 family transposase [Photorhabdus asymbiotica]CAR66710.1 putative is30 family transposase [Photorhabdus asymbiotica subsp. asymbiotica ATCC 43949]